MTGEVVKLSPDIFIPVIYHLSTFDKLIGYSDSQQIVL